MNRGVQSGAAARVGIAHQALKAACTLGVVGAVSSLIAFCLTGVRFTHDDAWLLGSFSVLFCLPGTVGHLLAQRFGASLRTRAIAYLVLSLLLAAGIWVHSWHGPSADREGALFMEAILCLQLIPGLLGLALLNVRFSRAGFAVAALASIAFLVCALLYLHPVSRYFR